jgi:hypothetical protein
MRTKYGVFAKFDWPGPHCNISSAKRRLNFLTL